MNILKGFSNTKEHKNNYFLTITIFVVLSLILTFVIEVIHNNDFTITFNWCLAAPQIFIANFILVLVFTLFLYCICGCIYISSSMSYFILLIVSLASYYKEKFLGDPIFPWDLMLKREGFNIFPLLQEGTGFVILLVVIMVSLVIFLLRFFLPRFRSDYVPRILIGLLAFLILLTVSYIKPKPMRDFLSNAGMGEISWKQDDNYKKNGIMLSFLRNIKNAVISKPSGYTKQNVLAVMNEDIMDESDSNHSTKSPNIIFVMSEAFWDPTLLKSVSFSSDPIPTFRNLQKNYTSGWLLSPQYGGLTANVEFEVLTGNSTSFLPQGAVPYQQFIKEPILSIASILKGQGYYTAAVHSYLGWFWNRNSVYQKMGFDTFISSEAMKKAKHKGYYISDSEVSRQIIDQLENKKQPIFLYAITMQNHGPYDQKRYNTNEIKVNGDISDKSKSILETYVQGLKDADNSLKILVDYVNTFKEPTIIVFFGDHLPLLGDDYSVYKDTGYLSSEKSQEWALEDYKKMRSVPVVIWSNFKQNKKEINNMSDSFLGLYVLKMAGAELPPYFRYVDYVYSILPGFLKELKIDSQGNLHPGDDKDYKKLMDKYWLIEYDKLFGKKLQEND